MYLGLVHKEDKVRQRNARQPPLNQAEVDNEEKYLLVYFLLIDNQLKSKGGTVKTECRV